ncbi:MAG: AIPR family protein, partial [Propioniciclava sp.]
HVEVEQLSRTVWAPSPSGTIRQTRWFYERARGQYQVELSRQTTRARQRAWKEEHPPSQKFTKTDLAKYLSAWEQLPHETSRGAQKNFTLFTARLVADPQTVDVGFFQELIAKAILWKSTERIVTAQKFGGYRANLVAYSIAKLSHLVGGKLDFELIWRGQDLPGELRTQLERLSHLAWRIIVTDAPPGMNITEWAKSDRCWSAMRDAAWERDDLSRFRATPSPTDGNVEVGDEADERWQRLSSLGSAYLDRATEWAKETGHLKPWQRTLLRDAADRMRRGQRPRERHLEYAGAILDELESLGFGPPEGDLG